MFSTKVSDTDIALFQNLANQKKANVSKATGSVRVSGYHGLEKIEEEESPISSKSETHRVFLKKELLTV